MSNDKAAATGYAPQEYALAQPVKPRKKLNPTIIAAAGATLALVGGVVMGVSIPKATPAACEQALTYAEQGLTQSGKGLEAMGGAVGGNWGKMMKAQQEMESITTELNRLSPLYKDAKKECLK